MASSGSGGRTVGCPRGVCMLGRFFVVVVVGGAAAATGACGWVGFGRCVRNGVVCGNGMWEG